MKRSLVIVCLSILLFHVALVAQDTGRLALTLERGATPNAVAAPVAGAKVIIMHWTNPGLHPMLVRDKIATTDQTGMCSVELPPGVYDVFISASELIPRAYQASIKAGATASYSLKMVPAAGQLKPIE